MRDQNVINAIRMKTASGQTQVRFKCLEWFSFITGVLAIGLCSVSHAENSVELKEEITVTATRTEKPLSEVANTVTVIDAEQIANELAVGIDDLVRYEPGVTVSGGGRYGLNSFSIRGVDGDRVLTLVDNTPTADELSFGPFLSSLRDFVDLDALKSVEIVRGPGSSVYGSNAIGGVVNFITKNPIDYLHGDSFAGSIKVGMSSVDASTYTTLLTAFGNETWSGMVLGTLRDGAETDTFFNDDSIGASRQAQNPQNNENTNVYSKIMYTPDSIHSLSLVAERFTADSATDVLSAAGTLSRGVLTNSQIGVDERTRQRVSLDYDRRLLSSLADSLNVLIYAQSSEALQNTFTERASNTGVQDRTRGSVFEQENMGVRVQFEKNVERRFVSNNLVVGIDYDVSDTLTLRDGQTINRGDGALLPEFSNFPTRDFPNSQYTSLGVFVQNEMHIFDGRLSLIPAIRYDNFKLDPSVDAVYLSGNTGSPVPQGYDESELSAKLGLVYDLSDYWSIYAQYAEGFRAPPLDAVNSGFTNFAGGYTTLPNADLRPEHGESVELGLRRFSDNGRLEITAYNNSYEGFIESLAVRGFTPVTRLLEFQARNLDEAEINGLEIKANYDLSAISEKLDGFQLRAAYAYAKGEDKQSNQPLNSINPQSLVFGLSYVPSELWGIEAIVTAADKKSARDIDASSLQEQEAPAVSPFETPSFVLLDLLGHYNINDNARLNWGIFNVADEQVYRWSEEFVQDPATTNFDRLTEPGRNYSITIKYEF